MGRTEPRKPQRSKAAQIRTMYDNLAENQVWNGPGGPYVASKRGTRWLLFNVGGRHLPTLLVKKDGSVRSGRKFDKPFEGFFEWTGELGTFCGACGYPSTPDQPRHRIGCRLRRQSVSPRP